MARNSTKFVCQNCGAQHVRWSGRCDNCGEWNTLVEEDAASAPVSGSQRKARPGRPVALSALSGEEDQPPRVSSQVLELDRVCGGGLVRGSALLVGGDPGIGKSTLLLQAAAGLANAGRKVVYVSGEEAIDQVRLRATRLGLARSNVGLAAETNVENILATLETGTPADLVVIDSIQTLWTDSIESAPGTVSQVRASAQMLIRHAKRSGSAVVLVGHVTKDGQIAGPRVVEHMVDAVLYFEGDGAHQFRLLRAVKNRFGPTDEIGVFEMSDMGLREVPNPSALFLGERDAWAPGAAVFAGMEGTRPILVEIQALVAPSTLATPRRAVVGWDSNRLSMILAVLDAHCGLKLGAQDVYLNVAGGLRIVEPAADLAVAAALVSSMARSALQPDAVYFGEISLSGAIRPVGHEATRLKEAAKLGFTQAIAPGAGTGGQDGEGLRTRRVDSLSTLVAAIAANAPKREGEDT
ncbi:DNA repair protein RadA [Tepidamorphus sp. 3E244]|uniref:DNA repair protein RadA n=1 Tax=Tepidamorphus sp. 3E244 TaxID=3385498 RepID=UPI0038FCD7DC